MYQMKRPYQNVFCVCSIVKQWTVDSRQWAVGSGQQIVDSRYYLVDSRQCLVDSRLQTVESRQRKQTADSRRQKVDSSVWFQTVYPINWDQRTPIGIQLLHRITVAKALELFLNYLPFLWNLDISLNQSERSSPDSLTNSRLRNYEYSNTHSICRSHLKNSLITDEYL